MDSSISRSFSQPLPCAGEGHDNRELNFVTREIVSWAPAGEPEPVPAFGGSEFFTDGDGFASVINDAVELKVFRQRSGSEVLPILPQFVPCVAEQPEKSRLRKTLQLRGEREPTRMRCCASRQTDISKSADQTETFRAMVRARRDCVSPELGKFTAEFGKSQKDVPSQDKPVLLFKARALAGNAMEGR